MTVYTSDEYVSVILTYAPAISAPGYPEPIIWPWGVSNRVPHLKVRITKRHDDLVFVLGPDGAGDVQRVRGRL